MRRPLLSAFASAVLALAAAAPAGGADDARALWRENRRLAAEAALAATPKPYFLLDLERRRLALRTRGMDLFEVSVAEAGVWGRRLAIGPTAVVRRDALVRPEIRPGEETTQETLDQQLLELDDMPTSYRLFLAGDVEVQVLSLPEEGRLRWRHRAAIWRWRLSRPLVTLRQRRERRETTTMFIVLKAVDARRVYWSFFEGLDGILIPP